MKKRIQDHPVVSSLLIIIVWFVLSTLFVFATSLITNIPIFDVRIQNVGRLAGIIVLAVIAFRFQLVDLHWITNLAGWKCWLIVLLISIYSYYAGNLAFFGDVKNDLLVMLNARPVREILGTQVLVGFMEELLFRGIIFSLLLHKWGNDRRGIFLSAAVSSALFASLHLLHLMNVTTAEDIRVVMANKIYTLIPGVWLALCVFIAQSLWPAVVLHGLGNAVILIPGLTKSNLGPIRSYVRLGLVDLVIMLAGIYLIIRNGKKTERDK